MEHLVTGMTSAQKPYRIPVSPDGAEASHWLRAASGPRDWLLLDN